MPGKSRRMAVQLALKQLEWKFDRTPNLCLNPPSEQPDREHCSSQLLPSLLLLLCLPISPSLPAGSHCPKILSGHSGDSGFLQFTPWCFHPFLLAPWLNRSLSAVFTSSHLSKYWLLGLLTKRISPNLASSTYLLQPQSSSNVFLTLNLQYVIYISAHLPPSWSLATNSLSHK